MSVLEKKNLHDSPWNLDDDAPFLAWREEKLRQCQALHDAPAIPIRDLAAPSEAEQEEIRKRCALTNMALYQCEEKDSDADTVRAALRGFSETFGLEIAEKHRSAGSHGIVALTVTQKASQRGYIPYSTRAMNWHTDGYYNSAEEQIRAMVLHCFRPAAAGGRNQFLDPEIAYIRLRDHNKDFIKALSHPAAMTIPENREDNGKVRPESVGPVFSVAPDGRLVMRYTARTRSIKWRDDELTKQAVTFLQNLLERGDPLMQTVTLTAGQGVLCNNSLHNRTGFENETDNRRMLFRVRFHNPVKGG